MAILALNRLEPGLRAYHLVLKCVERKKKRCFVKTYSNEQEKKCEPQLNNYFINASVGLGNYSEDISLFTMLWRLSMAGRCLLGRPCLWGIWQKAR